VSSKGLILGGEGSKDILKRFEDDHPLAVQIFGENPIFMGRAAEFIDGFARPFQAIDINMGCPSRKIVSQGAGSALLKDIPRALSIVERVKAQTSIPVTVKIRLGWDFVMDVPSFVCRLAEAGADMVTIHGRTWSQGYSGKADWGPIIESAKISPVPVVGNGDIGDASQAVKILNSNHVQGVMIGRGALANPYIFRECAEILKGNTAGADLEQRMEMAARHLEKSIEEYGEDAGLPRMRKHLAFYVKGLPNAARIREYIHKETSPYGVLELLNGGWKRFL
jgi:tRNA-dihydrouridine synthase B